MAQYTAERIRKRSWPKSKVLVKEEKPKYIVGFDSEADTSSRGKPMLFQFSLPDTTEDECITIEIPESTHAGLHAFVSFMDSTFVDDSKEYLIYVWNLAYEMTQIFHDLPKRVKETDTFTIEDVNGWKIEVLNYKRQILTFRKGRIFCRILDGMAFYKTSLDSAARMLELGEKYEMKSLSRSLFTRADLKDPDFLTYAKRDAYITRKVGEYIQLQHHAFGVPTTISAPHFAASVFRTLYMSKSLPKLSTNVEQAGLYSYHGGKNGFYLNGPAEFDNIYQYDITSAYPEAMYNLPDIEEMSWEPVKKFDGLGIYCISGIYKPCIFGGLQLHDGTWAQSGRIENVWTTSYELEELLGHGELRLQSVNGYKCVGPRGRGALHRYVTDFFQLKRTSVGPKRETAKLFLNSLYGKFFQKQPLGDIGTFDIDNMEWRISDPNATYDYEAGGLYNPPVASLITGYVRGKIHRLEHKYDSIMTSTDGFFGRNAPDPSDIGTDLGKLTVQSGRLRIWRERLYIFESDGSKPKIALHGFRDNADALQRIPLVSGTYHYRGTQMITLKMSTRRVNGDEFEPGQFVSANYQITI